MVHEMLVDVTAAEGSYRLGPAAWVWGSGSDVGRNGGTWEEVDFYGLGRPFHGIHAAAYGVESAAVACGVGCAGAAARIAVSGTAVAVRETA